MESAFFTVADWVANPRSNSIRRKNRRSVLPPRLMDLLFYFAQHPMEVVSRQEIIDNCWDRDVVTDQAITQAIFELRKFLKDGRSAKEAPEYIKTVPKRGYRLLAPVHQLTVEEYIAATSENGAQGTQVIDDEDVAAERELQQPVSAAEPDAGTFTRGRSAIGCVSDQSSTFTSAMRPFVMVVWTVTSPLRPKVVDVYTPSFAKAEGAVPAAKASTAATESRETRII